MNRSTVKKSIDRMQEMVKDRTPVQKGPGGGSLRLSIKADGPYRNRRRRWQGSVYSDNDHAAHIEYGTPPHLQTAKTGRAMAWKTAASRNKDGYAYSREHTHPGHKGEHMFQETGAVFAATEAKDLAERNARLWLFSPGVRPTFISLRQGGN